MFPTQVRATVHWFALTVACAALLLTAGVAAGRQAAAGSPAPGEKQTSAPAQGATPQQTAATTATSTPAKQGPKRVYDNDNMPRAGGAGADGADFSGINDCDRNCFEQVRQLARVNIAASPNWKRELLQSIETVRKDAEWQQYLKDLHEMYLRFCKIGEEKREEMEGVADPKNVTPRELTVDEKYDKKFKEAQTAVQGVYARQRGVQQRFATNPFAMTFTNVQVSRIQRAPCVQQRYAYNEPSDSDDP